MICRGWKDLLIDEALAPQEWPRANSSAIDCSRFTKAHQQHGLGLYCGGEGPGLCLFTQWLSHVSPTQPWLSLALPGKEGEQESSQANRAPVHHQLPLTQQYEERRAWRSECETQGGDFALSTSGTLRRVLEFARMSFELQLCPSL